MKWQDHRRITEIVCRVLDVPTNITSKLLETVILPDKQPDYIYYYRKGKVRRKRVSHHDRQALDVAWMYLKKARLK